MDSALLSLIAASVTFVGAHFVMSHPLRAPMVGILGETGFQAVYSVIVLASMVWMYFAFTAIETPSVLWAGGFTGPSWIVASAITLIAMVLLVGSMTPKNPALGAPGAEDAARAAPQGVFTITRHPMMWAFALWAIAHIVAAPTERTVVVSLAVLVMALVGAKLQDAKKEQLMGEAWHVWEGQTSYWPRISGFASVGFVTWLIGAIAWFGLSWLHMPLGNVAAGLWRWMG
ncbi:NnrU family protein [Parerythrobacter jejuensis]|uniref:MFS transporter n=1 Tax=Parerythrobacter jejuensis TaxID=795812 RepID=A0A845ARB4_9SPHN|nr:NnrU family protein [Parerythrobacter jejuensis]MXP31046.1 MFS transporter [Parerythrobacter jejuensis]MXP33806.1 MFS transporter [Parerythrobacter jejuensis]